MTRKQAIEEFTNAKIGTKFLYRRRKTYGTVFKEVLGKITSKYADGWGYLYITFTALKVKNWPDLIEGDNYKFVPDEYFVWFSNGEFKPETSTEVSKSGKEIEFSIRKK